MSRKTERVSAGVSVMSTAALFLSRPDEPIVVIALSAVIGGSLIYAMSGWALNRNLELYQKIGRWLVVGVLGAAFGAGMCGWKWPHKGKVQAFLSDRCYFPMREIQLKGNVNRAYEIIQTNINGPKSYLMLSPASADHLTINVVLRNVSDLTIKQATFTVFSSTEFKAITEGAYQQSPKEAMWTINDHRPFKDFGREHYFTLSIPIPERDMKFRFLVIEESDDVSYSAVGEVNSVRLDSFGVGVPPCAIADPKP